MPPRKKARLSSRAASSLSVETPVEMPTVVNESEAGLKVDESIPGGSTVDPWTDEQEISLFKGMIKWKPVGMHKHFRMLSLSQYLQNHGHNPKKDPHTSIPGIWAKLNSLYNLKVLDEREDSYGEALSDDNDPAKEPFVPFKLPASEFGELMFARRLAPPGSSLSPSLPHQLSDESHEGGRRPSVIDDSEEPRSSPASARGMKSTRGRRGMRRSQLHEQSTPTARSTSKASVDVSGEGEEQGEEEDDEDASANESEEEATPVAPVRGGRWGTKPGRGGRGPVEGEAEGEVDGNRRGIRSWQTGKKSSRASGSGSCKCLPK